MSLIIYKFIIYQKTTQKTMYITSTWKKWMAFLPCKDIQSSSDVQFQLKNTLKQVKE